MKALFLKEFRQGRPMLWSGLAAALLLPAGYHVLTHPTLLYLVGDGDAKAVRLGCGFVLLALPLFFALLASAGLFSSEADDGTLPVLFALPLSRRRIWLAKILAGVALTVAASAVLLAINAVLPPRLSRLPFWPFLPDLCLWAAFVCALGVFWSALAPNMIASLAGALGLGLGLVVGVVTLYSKLGAPLLGGELPVLDFALWAFFLALPLLLASAFVVCRGELLQSFRVRISALLIFLAGAALVVAVVCGICRLTTRYQRGDIALLGLDEGLNGAKLIGLEVAPAPSGFAQARWRALMRMAGQRDADLRQESPFAVPHYVVALELATGRELMARLAPRVAGVWESSAVACSRDGRFIAWVSRPVGLTWGALVWPRPNVQILRIMDLQDQKLLYEGVPEPFTSNASAGLSLAWSPTSSYLAVLPQEYRVSFTMRRDGSGLRQIAFGFEHIWWSPRDDVLFGIGREKALFRIHPDGRAPQVIWKPQAGKGQYDAWFSPGDMSPDGRWIPLGESRDTPTSATGVRKELDLRLIRTDGSESRLIWRSDGKQALSGIAWASDASGLYGLICAPGKENLKSHRLHVWRPGSDSLVPLGPELLATQVRLFARPGFDGVFVWARRLGPRPSVYSRVTPWRLRAESGRLLVIYPTGTAREISPPGSPRLAAENTILGFDAQGRLLFKPTDLGSLKALDLDSLKIRQIYP